MCRVSSGAVKAITALCLIEGICYIGFNIFCITMWACVPDLNEIDGDDYFFRLYSLRYVEPDQCSHISVLDQMTLKSLQELAFDRSSQILFIFNVIYLALHTLWILAGLLVFAAARKPERRIPFLLITVVLCGLDVGLSITFGLDLGNDDTVRWNDFNIKSVGLFPVIFFGRGLILWLLNIFALISIASIGQQSKSKKDKAKKTNERQAVQRSPQTSPVPPPMREAPESDSTSTTSSSEDEEPEERQRPAPIVLPKPHFSTRDEPRHSDAQDHPPEPRSNVGLYPVLPAAYDNEAFHSEDISSSSSEESDVQHRNKRPAQLRNQKQAWSYLDTKARRHISHQSSPADAFRDNHRPVISPKPDYEAYVDDHMDRALNSPPIVRPADPPVDYFEAGFRHENRSRF